MPYCIDLKKYFHLSLDGHALADGAEVARCISKSKTIKVNT
jgi:hypothetical protein